MIYPVACMVLTPSPWIMSLFLAARSPLCRCKLIQDSAKTFASQPTDPLLRFSSLAQGLWGTLPTAMASAQPQPSGRDLPPNLVQTVQNLQLQVKDLSTKLASLSAEKRNY
jgi:hypothetical protein